MISASFFFGWGPSYFLGRGIELCIPLSFSLVCSCFCKSNRTAYCSGPGYGQVKQSKAKEEKYDETTTSESQSRNFKNREREREKKARETKIVKRPYRLFYLSLSLNFFFYFPPSFERRAGSFVFIIFRVCQIWKSPHSKENGCRLLLLPKPNCLSALNYIHVKIIRKSVPLGRKPEIDLYSIAWDSCIYSLQLCELADAHPVHE